MKCDKLLKEALDSIDLNYKLNDVLDDMASKNPKQKFSVKQLEGYLRKQGVSPYEIKASRLFEEAPVNGSKGTLTIKEWAENNPKKQMFEKFEVTDNPSDYGEYTLGRGGMDSPTYKENLFMANKPDRNEPSIPHFANQVEKYNTSILQKNEKLNQIKQDLRQAAKDDNDIEFDRLLKEKVAIEKPNKTLLGWNRVHQAEVNGKPSTVLNELQSDWAQTERAGRGTFESNVPSNKDLENLKSKLNDINLKAEKIKIARRIEKEKLKNQGKNNAEIRKILEPYRVKLSKLSKERLDVENNIDLTKIKISNFDSDVVSDFPMKPDKFHQLMIVDALNEAIENGTKRVVIPIEREGELAGSAGVTKFYDSLNKKILPDIRKKLEKQGFRVKLSKEEIEASKPQFEDITDDLYLAADNFELDISKEDLNYFISQANNNIEELYNLLEPIDTIAALKIKDSINQAKTIPLHVLEIEPIKGKKVKWDVYSLATALGLGSYINKGEEN